MKKLDDQQNVTQGFFDVHICIKKLNSLPLPKKASLFLYGCKIGFKKDLSSLSTPIKQICLVEESRLVFNIRASKNLYALFS